MSNKAGRLSSPYNYHKVCIFRPRRCENISTFHTGLVRHSDLLHSILWRKKLIRNEIQPCSPVRVRATSQSFAVSCCQLHLGYYGGVKSSWQLPGKKQLPPVLLFQMPGSPGSSWRKPFKLLQQGEFYRQNALKHFLGPFRGGFQVVGHLLWSVASQNLDYYSCCSRLLPKSNTMRFALSRILRAE